MNNENEILHAIIELGILQRIMPERILTREQMKRKEELEKIINGTNNG